MPYQSMGDALSSSNVCLLPQTIVAESDVVKLLVVVLKWSEINKTMLRSIKVFKSIGRVPNDNEKQWMGWWRKQIELNGRGSLWILISEHDKEPFTRHILLCAWRSVWRLFISWVTLSASEREWLNKYFINENRVWRVKVSKYFELW